MHERVGTYWHMLPEASQARKAIWDAVNPRTGKMRIDEAFPHELRSATRSQDMLIKLRSGSSWQVLGSDNFNSFVGSPPVGVVFSEWALADPAAWSYVRPILAENGGWAVFITTPRGKNHAYQMLRAYQDDPDWYCEVLPASRTDVFTPGMLETERRDMIRENGEAVGNALFRQEYECSFEQAIVGSIYADEMGKARAASPTRITKVPYDPVRPVIAALDLGKTDSTALWCAQTVGTEVHWIDYFEDSGKDPAHYWQWLRDTKYRVAEIILPHDARARLLGAPLTVEQSAQQAFGADRVRVLPASPVTDGINALRSVLARSWIDEDKCERGIACLDNYRYNWDPERRAFSLQPVHDWASHGSDAARYMAVGLSVNRQRVAAIPQRPQRRKVWTGAQA